MNNNLPAPRDRLLSVKEAAKALNLSIKTIYRAIDTGALPHHRFGRTIRIAPADLNFFINQNRT